ncbi:MAG: hypothetical protein FJ137_12740 [Deltaproteobacteria bacterium]|nr:hypothetical protein [Deltaproteobacteria bacterium]
MRALPTLLSSSVLVVALAGCQAKVATVEITPANFSFRSESQSQRLTATPKEEDGAAIEGERPVTWASADPAVAAVDAQGLVKPIGSGKTTITATIEERTATATVDVLLTKAIRLPSLAAVVLVGKPSEAYAVAFTNEKGEPITPDASVGKVTWKTENPAVATVSDEGVVTGLTPGSTTLTVATKELKAEMTVTVNPAPEGAAVDGATPPAPAPPGPAPAK